MEIILKRRHHQASQHKELLNAGLRWPCPPDSAVASLLDLAGTKASVVQVQAEAKDYIDIDALMTDGRVDLPTVMV